MDIPTHKICTKCKKLKPISSYSKHPNSKYGLQPQCKECKSAYDKELRARKASTKKVSHKICPTCKVDKPADAYHNNKNKEDGLHYECKECRVLSSNVYYEDNKEDISIKNSIRYYENHTKRRIQQNEYKRNHQSEANERERKRRALKKNLTIGEVPLNIKEWLYYLQYGDCALCPEKLDFDTMHVDHIYPTSKQGPHVIYNLQGVHGSCNSRKHNKITEKLVENYKLYY